MHPPRKQKLHKGTKKANDVHAELGGYDCFGGNWASVDPQLSLQPRLPHGLHCSLSLLLVFVAIGPLRSPFVSFSLPPWLGLGIWAPGFWALLLGHFTLVLTE